jgi:hypothetical protein
VERSLRATSIVVMFGSSLAPLRCLAELRDFGRSRHRRESASRGQPATEMASRSSQFTRCSLNG